jgi:hypothetical protein
MNMIHIRYLALLTIKVVLQLVCILIHLLYLSTTVAIGFVTNCCSTTITSYISMSNLPSNGQMIYNSLTSAVF